MTEWLWQRTGHSRGIAQRKKKQPKQQSGALRNQRTASVCNRRSCPRLAFNLSIQNEGKSTDRDSQRSKGGLNWRGTLHRCYPFIAIFFLSITKWRAFNYMCMHCWAYKLSFLTYKMSSRLDVLKRETIKPGNWWARAIHLPSYDTFTGYKLDRAINIYEYHFFQL